MSREIKPVAELLAELVREKLQRGERIDVWIFDRLSRLSDDDLDRINAIVEKNAPDGRLTWDLLLSFSDEDFDAFARIGNRAFGQGFWTR